MSLWNLLDDANHDGLILAKTKNICSTPRVDHRKDKRADKSSGSVQGDWQSKYQGNVQRWFNKA